MNATSHTPGPWYVEPSISPRHVAAKGPFFICDMQREKCASPEDVATTEANARLIAAAPELLEALMTAKAILFEHVFAHDNSYVNAEQQITAAIAKATQA